MDGNGRWATEQGKGRTAGHAAAVENMLRMTRATDFSARLKALQIDTISLYAFAKKNWKRDKSEVDFLWDLFAEMVDRHGPDLIKNKIRFRCLGDRDTLPVDALSKIERLEADTIDFTSFTLQVALSYDGVDEVVRATRAIAEKVQAGALAPADITEATVAAHLDTHDIPDPDILIRTGMDELNYQPEKFSLWRGSSFLQLQSAQSVCVSTSIRWPDFSMDDLETAVTLANPDARLFGGQRQ